MRIFSVTLLAFFIFAFIPRVEAKTELVLLNWADYLEDSLILDFEKICACKVRQVYFETDDHRDALLLTNEGAEYDVIVTNGLKIEAYSRRGWLAEKPAQGLRNEKYIRPELADAFTGAKQYAVPYFWGTMGIGYRKDLVKTPITSWKQLFNPADEMKGKIRLINSARDLLGAALKAQNHSLNTTDRSAIAEAKSLLMAVKPHVEDFIYISQDENSPLVTGDTVAAITFSGDTLMIQEFDDNIEYVLPEEGGLIWIDHLAVSARSKNKTLAWSFIDFLHEPANAARNAEYVYYATPNTGAEKILPDSFLHHPVIYPSPDSLKNSEYYQALPPRVEKLYGEAFLQIIN